MRDPAHRRRPQPRGATPSGAALVGVAAALAALTAADGARAGTVSGKLELPAAPARPPIAHPGYLDRGENPYLPVLPFDPTPQMVIVLEGGPAGKGPAEASWELRGDAFSQPLLPVTEGTTVVVKNTSRQPVTLTVLEDPTLLKNAVINPPSSKQFKAPATGTVLTVVDPERPHVRARVLVVATPYATVPSSNGTFEITDVPAGKWTVRVWYGDGWLDRPDDTITVGAGKTDVRLQIPAGYPVRGATRSTAPAGDGTK
ncbi:MAG: hypothetical protein R2939_15200 [Kofleriaceae bacterium]